MKPLVDKTHESAVFYKLMLKKYGKHNTERLRRAVEGLLMEAVNDERYDITGHNHPDYCHAFGVMCGAAYGLGFEYAMVTNDMEKPGYWFDVVLKAVKSESVQYQTRQEKNAEKKK